MPQPMLSAPVMPVRPSVMPRRSPVFTALLGAVTVACMIIMGTGPGLVAWLDAGPGAGAEWNELLIAFALSISLPPALVITAVYLPILVAMRQASLPGEPVALFALAGMLAGPIAGWLLLAGGHHLFAQGGGTLLQDLARLYQSHLSSLLGLSMTLMLGGAAFGAGVAWATRYAETPFRG